MDKEFKVIYLIQTHMSNDFKVVFPNELKGLSDFHQQVAEEANLLFLLKSGSHFSCLFSDTTGQQRLEMIPAPEEFTDIHDFEAQHVLMEKDSEYTHLANTFIDYNADGYNLLVVVNFDDEVDVDIKERKVLFS